MPFTFARMICSSSSFDGIADLHLQHEPVHLRFGKRIGSLLLDRVLRGKHQERLGELERLFADRHLALLHRLEQRALHLGGGAVDLVRQDEVGEDRPLPRLERAVLLIVDHACRPGRPGEGRG